MAIIKITMRRYDQTQASWFDLHPETSGSIVRLGKDVSVTGAAIGSYANGSTIPATASVTDIIEQIAATPAVEVTWANLSGKPASSVDDIDAAVTLSKKFTASDDAISYNAKQLAFVDDIPTTYDAAKITGVIKIENLPASALERLVVVADETARLALTETEVQVGDTVKETSTGKMFYVKDASKLGTADAFEEYTVGSAASVPWSGVTGTPTTLAGYGITDAVNVADTSDVAAAGKVVKYTAEGKLNGTASDADKLGGQLPAYYAKQSDMETAQTDITNLKSGEAITALAASKLTGTVSRNNLPADVSGKVVPVANKEAMLALTAEQVNRGDIVKLDNGQVYGVNNVSAIGTEAAFVLLVDIAATSIAWSQITNTPTTIAGYGITDAVNVSEVSAAAEANKIVKRDADGKIAGTVANAETLEGHAASYFATASDMSTAQTDIANLKSGEAIVELAASKIKGVLSLDNIPAAAVERLTVVADSAARLALTSADIQVGDTVKETSTGKMFYVKDASKLGTEEAFEEYTVGSAASVPWTGVTGKPTTLAGYGITDNIALFDENGISNTTIAFEKVTGLDASVTADALKQAVADDHTHANKAVLDKLTEDEDGALLHNSKEVAYVADVATLAQIPVLSADPSNPTDGQIYFKIID